MYDRPGYGWSESGFKPRSSWQISSEMREMIEKSGESGPFVLVGHSFGGYNVRVFTSRYPDLVSGLVLIDAMHENQGKQKKRGKNKNGIETEFWAAQNISSQEGFELNKKVNDGVFFLKQMVPTGIWRIMIGFPFVSPQLNATEQNLQRKMSSQNTWADAIYSEGE